MSRPGPKRKKAAGPRFPPLRKRPRYGTSPEFKRVWKDVVAGAPAGWFVASDELLLTVLCEAVVERAGLRAELAGLAVADPVWKAVVGREKVLTDQIRHLAVSLRLVPSERARKRGVEAAVRSPYLAKVVGLEGGPREPWDQPE